jgi:hypothetical protein
MPVVNTVGDLQDILSLIPQSTPIAVKLGLGPLFYRVEVNMLKREDGSPIYCIIGDKSWLPPAE